MKPIIAFLLALCPALTAAQDKAVDVPTPCRKNLPIDEFLLPDDAAAAKAAFEELRVALLSGNRSRVIELVAFPADLVLDGRGVKFDTAREFEKRYEEVFTEYVTTSVREQNPEELTAGWEGVSLSNEAVRFRRTEAGDFRIDGVRPRPASPPDFVKEFLDKRLTCPPVVVEGRIVAYNWVTHQMPGFENIYIDHFIADVTNVLRGTVAENRIRVDFWGLSHMPEYNLPPRAFAPGSTWRMYLRRAGEPPANSGVCRLDVPETISSVNEAGVELEKMSAIEPLSGETSLTYVGLRCFETGKQFFEPVP
ncbi:MAG TPA: hypothetical protein VJP87_11165 [Candidatus Acidoferrales bacterium]|nr:hypothetical protein [Candidatus Acidoferrales bacterium]